MSLQDRMVSLLRTGSFTLECHLCGGEDQVDDWDLLHEDTCLDCQVLLWDSRNMVENDNAGANCPLSMVRSGS